LLSSTADLSKRIDALIQLIQEPSESASRAATHLGKEDDTLKSSKSYCIALHARVEHMLNGLNGDYPRFKRGGVEAAFVTFAEACTGGDFELGWRSARGPCAQDLCGRWTPQGRRSACAHEDVPSCQDAPGRTNFQKIR
jgi:hypothetical protein